jgi:hypothetical protein
MIMMEEFRRRKNMQDLHKITTEKKRSLESSRGNNSELPF